MPTESSAASVVPTPGELEENASDKNNNECQKKQDHIKDNSSTQFLLDALPDNFFTVRNYTKYYCFIIFNCILKIFQKQVDVDIKYNHLRLRFWFFFLF